MAVLETAGRGSIPRRGTETNVLGVLRIARDPAKVEDQVRLLARTLNIVALEPDGKAAACMGSTPTGASDYPTAWFGLHPVKMTPSEPFPRWRVLIQPNCLLGLHFQEMRGLGEILVGSLYDILSVGSFIDVVFNPRLPFWPPPRPPSNAAGGLRAKSRFCRPRPSDAKQEAQAGCGAGKLAPHSRRPILGWIFTTMHK